MKHNFTEGSSTKITRKQRARINRAVAKAMTSATVEHPIYTSNSDFHRTSLIKELRRAENELGLEELKDKDIENWINEGEQYE